MRISVIAGLALALISGSAWSADYRTLRNLQAPPAVELQPLAAGEKVQPVRFAKVVVHPRDGEAWAVVYASIPVRAEGDTRPPYRLIPWENGRIDADSASFGRAFDEELAKAGFKSDGSEESLFANAAGPADLQVAVLIDDVKGRFCTDCPNILNRKGVGAVVTMSARWEVYSSLQGKVIFKTTTSGGGVIPTRLQGSMEPAVYADFRENVRVLLASPEFRQVVRASGPAAQPQAALNPISFRRGSSAKRGLASVPTAVATIFAGGSMGSGFLISADGYLLTNQHVVGGAPRVRIRWSDKSETIGEVIRSDRRRDVALIKADPHGRPPLAIRSGTTELGESVFAIGTPLDEKLQNTLTKGVVSANRMYEGQPFIQSDVSVAHGNSGGPLLDEKGAVIGLTDLGLYPEESKSLNLFIPIDDALRALGLKPAA
jgi:serine protease Do